MLRANLSTRPSYNERAAHLLIALGAVLAIAFTAVNVGRVVVLSRANTELLSRAADEESRARELRTEAQRVRQSLDPKKIEAVSTSAREANAIIDRRLFSWTELFNYFETALPDDVRITSVHPKTNADGTVTLALSVIGRRVEDVDRFLDELEGTRAFRDMLSRDERTADDGNLLAVLEGTYLPGRGTPPGSSAPAPSSPAERNR